MLIGAFAKASGLSPDTIRFYVRKGLMTPHDGSKGGRNPYQLFDEDHLRTARLIRMGQAVGMSLKEIEVVLRELRGGLTRERSLELMSEQIDRLESKRRELDGWIDYLRILRQWIVDGEPGPKPQYLTNVCQHGAADAR